MDGHVYAVASGKGGVGKTTTTLNVGIALRRRGHSVALVDADLAMANLGGLLDIGDRPTVHEVLAGDLDPEDVLVEHAEEFLLLPGDRSLDAYAGADAEGLRELVALVAERYEYILVDTGPSLSYDDVLPLGLVDALVPVTTADPAAVGDTRKTVELAVLVDTPVRGVVVNRADEGTDAAAVAREVGADLLGVVPESAAVASASAAGEPLWKRHGNSPAAGAYEAIAGALAEGGTADVTVETAGADTAGATSAGGTDGGTEAAEADDETAIGATTGASDGTAIPDAEERGGTEIRTGEAHDAAGEGPGADAAGSGGEQGSGTADASAGETEDAERTDEGTESPGSAAEDGESKGLFARISGLFR